MGILFLPPAGSRAATQQATSRPFDDYPDLAALEARIKSFPMQYPATVHAESIGTTARGHSVWALTIATPGGPPAASRSAVLLVAGLDAMHRAGPVAAV